MKDEATQTEMLNALATRITTLQLLIQARNQGHPADERVLQSAIGAMSSLLWSLEMPEDEDALPELLGILDQEIKWHEHVARSVQAKA